MCDVRRRSQLVSDAQRELAPTATYRQVADFFGALADPTRTTIAMRCRSANSARRLAAIVGISEFGVSQHLRILRALRVVNARRAGHSSTHTLDNAYVAAVLHMGLVHQGRGGVAQAQTA